MQILALLAALVAVEQQPLVIQATERHHPTVRMAEVVRCGEHHGGTLAALRVLQPALQERERFRRGRRQ
ncbi:hypothetical protein D3C84_1257810 [compost metagenome]